MSDPQSSSHPRSSDAGEPLPPPRPMGKRRFWRALVGVAGLTVAAGGVAFVLVASTATRARGATRSARLKWEARRRQVDQAVQEATEPQVEQRLAVAGPQADGPTDR